MERITPTGWAETGGREVKRFGGLRPLLEHMAALACGGAVIVGSVDAMKEADAMIRELRLQRNLFTIILDAGGPDQIYALRPGTYIGVHPDAFTRISAAMWGDFYRALDKRHGWVLWG